MFYTETMSDTLRFGDVITNIVNVVPHVENLDFSLVPSVNVEVRKEQFCVVLTPCCSIEKEKIAIVPLLQLSPHFLINEYFTSDFTNINRVMTAEQSKGSFIWAKLSPYEKEIEMKKGVSYTLFENFIYEGHERLPPYALNYKGRKTETNSYMVNFKDTFHIRSKSIVRDNEQLLRHKYLELSTETREELRNKISFFYSRIPDEDLCV